MPLMYAMDMNYLSNYVPIMIAEHTITMFFLIYLTSSDTLFCQLLTHICLQFKVIIPSLVQVAVKNDYISQMFFSFYAMT